MDRGPQKLSFMKQYHGFNTSFNEKSELDKTLEKNWMDCMKRGIFRYELEDLRTRILSGKYNFICQLNINRALHRRSPQYVSDIVMPFNHHEFNFSMIPTKEKLITIYDLYYDDMVLDVSEPGYKHLMIINDSPLEHCHSLLLPMFKKNVPQVLTFDALLVAVEVILFSYNSKFRLAYNSLGAYASVNHLHFHALYLKHELFLETAPVKHLKDRVYEVVDYPSEGFVFEILKKEDVLAVVRAVSKLIDFFIEKKIAHNVFFTRGIPFGQNTKEAAESESYAALRIYVWARETVFGSKNEFDFNVAVCELAGHLPLKDAKTFEEIDEDEVVKHLYATCHETFVSVRPLVVELFTDD